MKNFDVVCVGGAIIDAFLTIHEANKHCRIDAGHSELCVRFGEKIQVDKYEMLLGGDACNVSVGLARLSFQSALVAEIGEDEFAEKIVKGLLREHVNHSLVTQQKGAHSSFAIGIDFKNERTLFVAHAKHSHNFDLSGVLSKWVYLTSLGKEWQHAYQNVLALVESAKAKLAFSPGTVQLEEGLESFRNVLQKANILFVSKREAEEITGAQSDMETLAVQLQKFGPSIVVITDGANGSFCKSSDKMYRLSVFPANVVETTGAGDAYAAGFLGALVLEEDIATAMRWGAVNAASVIGKIGAQAGLLTSEELDKLLNDNPKFIPEVVDT